MQMCRGTHLIGFIVCTSVCTSSLTMKYEICNNVYIIPSEIIMPSPVTLLV